MPDSKIILTAADLDGYLTDGDKETIAIMHGLYDEAIACYAELEEAEDKQSGLEAEQRLIEIYDRMGKKMREIVDQEPAINVYSFMTPREVHGEASRLIAKLRNPKTRRDEFVYYVQRAFELLFNLTYNDPVQTEKNYIIDKTPVNVPIQNYSVHKIPNVDEQINNSVMCVMLRGALLPSIIMSKEIEEYSSTNYVTPFALFRIKRDDSKKEKNMEYILDLNKSFFDLQSLDGKDLVFADPMNATGGSLVTIITYLNGQGIKPKSIKFINLISALKGSLRTVRAIKNAEVYTLWMDPILNELAYILPGLGDAGDRLNGVDTDENPRNIIQLIADYGSGISALYRSQVREIERTVLG